MKYFSVKNWDEIDANAEKVAEYRTYINSVRSFLPKDLQLLTGMEEISLNDSRIESLTASSQNSTVNIKLNGRWIKGTVVGSRIFHLIYREVISLNSVIDPDAEGLHFSGYGFHGFDEVEIVKEGVYEHRMLFSSGIEFQIRFRDFSLEYTDPIKPA